MVEEVVGELELEEEEGEVEALAHDEVGEVPGVVVEDCLVVLHKLLDHRLLQDSGVEPEKQVKNVWLLRLANCLTILFAPVLSNEYFGVGASPGRRRRRTWRPR